VAHRHSLLCSAVLGLIVAANEIISGPTAAEPLAKLADDFRALSNANKIARDAVKGPGDDGRATPSGSGGV
jgi:hypothetical protein